MNKENRIISQTTYIICAKCGSIIKLDNRYESDVLTFEYMNNEVYNQLLFTCPYCKESYDLPCKVIRY